MNFYRNRWAPGIWILSSTLQIGMAVYRYAWRGHHDAYTIMQMCLWTFILLTWSWIGTVRWRFNPEMLEQRQIGARARNIPYSEIVSVDPISDFKTVTSFAIVYGAGVMFHKPQKMVVDPDKRAAFLEELERRAPQATFNV